MLNEIGSFYADDDEGDDLIASFEDHVQSLMMSPECLLQRIHLLRENNELYQEANLKLSSKLNDAMYKLNHLSMANDSSERVLSIGNQFEGIDVLAYDESSLSYMGVNLYTFEEPPFVSPLVNSTSGTRFVPKCHHYGDLGHIRPMCRKLHLERKNVLN
ncbi:hypothetical protein ACFX2I_037912 [Malus domestica]